MEKALIFPNEFPYEFAFTSQEDLMETEDETNEEDFISGLTRRLALFTQRLPSPPIDNAKLNSTESTLSQLGSCKASGTKSPDGPFSQIHSPPETPCREEVSLKIKVDAKPNRRHNPKPSSFTPFPQNAAFCSYYHYYCYCYYCCWLGRQPQPALFAYPYPVRGLSAAPTAVKQPCAGTGVFAAQTAVKQPSVCTGVSAAPTAVKQPCAGTGVFAAPTAVKQPSASPGVFTAPAAVIQPSAGTGVFLPRNYTNPSLSRKKAGKCVKLPTKVVQAQHPKTEKRSGRIQSRSQCCLSAGAGPSKLDRGTNKSAVSGGCPKEERHLPNKNGCTDLNNQVL